MKAATLIKKSASYIFLLFIAVVTLFPLFYVVLGSFKTNVEIMAHPEKVFPLSWTYVNYNTVWNSKTFNVPVLLKNSIYYTVMSVMINIVNSTVAAYVFERGRFRGKTIIYAVFTALMFVHMGSVTAYAAFKILGFLRIPISLNGLIFTKLFGIPIVNIMLSRSYIKGIPEELDEAAKIDGCGFVRILIKIYLPLLKPILITLFLLAFQTSWNDYLNPAIYTTARPGQRTLMVGLMALKDTSESAASWNLMLAGTCIALLPVLAVFIIGNKYFVDGLTTGAVKG